ncbi:Midasin [Sphaceloma murrayae]|uniref:Midasin n=1 Tax=Sphaceloma murrayae TaxID=2082308 RepID=A0A2K1QLU3_9PEZI|nr:Midasin [Sphaceloma murrayae]
MTDQIAEKWSGSRVPRGPWAEHSSVDVPHIDYRFLPMWERHRFQYVKLQLRTDPDSAGSETVTVPPVGSVVSFGEVLLPPLKASAERQAESTLIRTPTSQRSLGALADALRGQNPVLVTGQTGSGKSVLLRHTASVYGKLEKMITLHLNEQSDAKTLIGIYTTGATPGSFVWQAGVLTKAVTEGRWILIEDLERAPNEVLSVLLPLIEKRQLILPGRNQVIKAAIGFRIFATIRTSEDHRGREYDPSSSLLGRRHWSLIRFDPYPTHELATILSGTYPRVAVYLKAFVETFEDLRSLQTDLRRSNRDRSSTLRPISPRELFTWAARVERLVGTRETIDRDIEDQIFLSAVDCFAGFLPDGLAKDDYASRIAQYCGIDPQRKSHLLSVRAIAHRVQEAEICIGNYRFARRAAINTMSSRSKTFSMNRHTSRQVERIAAAVTSAEPLLLVGETGTGKTTSIQYLADLLGKRLTPFNLSQQSESGDLLGGFKPVNTRTIIIPLQDEFDYLFKSTFSTKVLIKNQAFLDLLVKCLEKQNWQRVCKCWLKAWGMVESLRQTRTTALTEQHTNGDGGPPKKRRVDSPLPGDLDDRWKKFYAAVQDVEARLRSGADDAIAFAFVEGAVVKAAREGDWVLLDEINLASSDTLEALADLFDKAPSIMLTEAGSTQRVNAHPDFRVFAAMNPATDVGKKDLPLGIRSRFTELYVDSPEKDLQSLQQIVQTYLGPSEVVLSEVVSRLHQEIARMCEDGVLIDGAGQKPHFSLRTLTRVLLFARDISGQCSLRRALHEGFAMSYLTMLDAASEQRVVPLIDQHFYGKHKKQTGELKTRMTRPTNARDTEVISMGRYWLKRGASEPEPQHHYIKTPSVQRNVDKLIRAAMTGRFPILLQGPTSSGKTSMVEYLAKETGHKFVRINNHEHTDLQEYLGSYISGRDGKLVFQEGLLVQAIKQGHWIVLDELNLAPTDVLEALNRLLDDNRELLIPDTQEIVRPHPNFMIFATQNPAGVYGGRKVLSRAFRNRFLELHFDDIPVDELQTILVARSQKAPSWCDLIVKVYKELSIIRQEGKVFEQKGFATLRDLFRWALRPAETVEDLARNGFMLLAERCRKVEERTEVKRVIEKVLSAKAYRLQIDEQTLYGRLSKSVPSTTVVWTKAMQRLYSLVNAAIANNEPVLLVGETGCGKTTVCQVLAELRQQNLHIVNAHQNTETGDLIGAQRPARNRAAIEKTLSEVLANYPDLDVKAALETDGINGALAVIDQIDTSQFNGNETDLTAIRDLRGELKVLFEWADGSLVEAMRKGELFLLDEISLADDSVLERLNSVLEPGRSILLAEKGTLDSFVTANTGFQFFATMNPGGDYGKKELSPALRNRFTEIWVPPLSEREDILQVLRAKLNDDVYATQMLDFATWFQARHNSSASSPVHIRDLLAWAELANTFTGPNSAEYGFLHGAAMVYMDGIGANPSGMIAVEDRNVNAERGICKVQLEQLLDKDLSYRNAESAVTWSELEGAPGLSILFKETLGDCKDADFLGIVTITNNAARVARALRLPKPILLEGAPGVGKTTLVADVAKAAGIPLTRINLSEQTDLMDLFGSDVPTEGEGMATFAWRDASFLRAMKQGEWVLLDEMNLASQSILEGLNACLDHRGEVYIPELNQTFQRHPRFRLFAAQNSHHQGGGRKGLPASFVNRFTVVYAEALTMPDLLSICHRSYQGVPIGDIEKVVGIIDSLKTEVAERSVGTVGAPWEFNLRDSKRWLELVSHGQDLPSAAGIGQVMPTAVSQRFRTQADRKRVQSIAGRFSMDSIWSVHELYHNLAQDHVQVGLALLERHESRTALRRQLYEDYDIRRHLDILESVMLCMSKNWPVLLVGASGIGKTTMIEQLARTVGADISTFSVNADIDSMDLVGGYEQHDPMRLVHEAGIRLQGFVRKRILSDAAAGALFERPVRMWRTAGQMSTSIDYPSEETLLEIHDWLQQLPISGDDVKAILQDVDQLIAGSSNVLEARFEWLDGVLVQAMQEGKWLILDNANLCSPAALDRLNSLLEPDGKLVINEHTTADGHARVVLPHPDFRIIMTMDPKHGELSRALRNRCVELYMPEWERDTDPNREYRTSSDDMMEITMRLVADHWFEDDVMKYVDGLASEISIGLFTGAVHTSEQSTGDYAEPTWIRPFRDVTIELVGLLGEQATDEVRSKMTDLLPLNPSNNPAPYLAVTDPSSGLRQFSVGHLMARSCAWEIAMECRNINTAIQSVAHSYQPGRRPSKLHLSSTDPEKDGFFKALVTIKNSIEEKVRSPDWLQDIAASYRFTTTGYGGELEYRERLPCHYTSMLEVLDRLVWLWWDLHDYAGNPNTSDAVLACLKHEVSRLAGSDHDIIKGRQLGADLKAVEAMLGSRLSEPAVEALTKLWRLARLPTPQDAKAAVLASRLIALASDLDKYSVMGNLPIREIAKLRANFSAIMGSVKDEKETGDSAFALLEGVVMGLKSEFEDSHPHQSSGALLAVAFEQLARHFDLIHAEAFTYNGNDNELFHLLYYFSGRPAMAMIPLGKTSSDNRVQGPSAQTLGFLANYGGIQASAEAFKVTSSLGVNLLGLLRGLKASPVVKLESLRAELNTMGRLVASNTHSLALHHGTHLHSILHDLLRDVLDSFCAATSPEIKAVAVALKHTLSGEVDEHSDVDPVETSGVQAAIAGGDTALLIYRFFDAPTRYCAHNQRFVTSSSFIGQLGQSWINFALGCIALFITRSPYDPAVAAHLAKELYERHMKSADGHLAALYAFEEHFSGTKDTTRIRLALQRIYQLRHARPSDPEVWRPSTSSIEALLAMFQSVQQMVQPYVDTIAEESCVANVVRDQQLRRNISVIKSRLANGFRDTQDLAGPLLGFLTCLEIGMDLVSSAQQHDSTDRSVQPALECRIPLSGSRDQVSAWYGFIGSPSMDVRTNATSPLVTLRQLKLAKVMTPSAFVVGDGLAKLRNVLDSVYHDWKSRLEHDQDENALQSSLYRYAGGGQVEDEAADDEFAEMFPDFENPSTGERVRHDNHQSQASLFADALGSIFDEAATPKAVLFSILDDAAETITLAGGESTSSMQADETLPLVIRRLDQEVASLKYDTVASMRAYNIYTDPNIRQVQAMADLVAKVQARFRTIQKAWPEHAILADVLQTCRELTDFAHTEPLMKIITKMEKLHDHIHEWQTVASKEFSAEVVYNRVSDLIVSWRQLELSTWSRMLDQEVKKCEEDAKEWFFIAYEGIITGTHQFQDSIEGMHEYIRELLKTLHSFFRSTGLGQYSTRLQIVEHLWGLIDGTDYLHPSSKRLLSASLSNFLSYFKRFEQQAHDAIARKRKALDADMRNVIQLASWKDRNILSLKQSAKISHRKLFRVIRKFRALLGQPVDSIISEGVFDADLVTSANAVVTGPEQDMTLSTIYRTRCEKTCPDYQAIAPRFRNVESTVTMIVSYSQRLSDYADVSHEVSTWVSDILSTASVLRKETPTLMTEEGKATAQHLKSRKRGLFSDVRRALEKMGFKKNLSTDVLGAQDSMVAVMTTDCSYLGGNDCRKAERSIHQLLHWMPQVRETGHQHSDDLTGADTRESIAFIESMLQNVILQRQSVCAQVAKRETYQTAIRNVQELSRAANIVPVISTLDAGSVSDGLRSLNIILAAAEDLIAAHFRLAEEDGRDVIECLRHLSNEIESKLDAWTQVPRLPAHLEGEQAELLRRDIKQTLQTATARLEELVEDNLPLGPLLSQAILWTNSDAWAQLREGPGKELDFSGLKHQICGTVDRVLAAVQMLPESVKERPQPWDGEAWLVREAKVLDKAVKRLHIDEVTDGINSVLSSLCRIPSQDINVAAAFLLTFTPIFEQYHQIHTQLTSRLIDLHIATTSMAAQFAKTYVTLARDGFCAPKEKDADPSGDNDDGVEAGTGLGDGEGAEDISKDIGDDEDLTELAQEKNEKKEDGDEIEDEKDAVDMANEEMEGEYGEQEKAQDEDGDGEEGEDEEVESEAGSVDDLGEGTVDEKMWDDGGAKDADKEQEADKADGTKDDEMAAAGDERKREEQDTEEQDGEGEEGDEEQVGVEEDENAEKQEAERADPRMQEEENLDLPDDIDMDGQKQDDDVDEDLDMMEEDGQLGEEQDTDVQDDAKVEQEVQPDDPLDQIENNDLDDKDLDQEANEAGETAEESEKPEDTEDILQDNRPDDSNTADEVAPSEARGNGLDEDQPQEDEDEEAQSGAAQRPQGAKGDDSEMQEAAGAQGQRGEADEQSAEAADDQEDETSAQRDRLRKLGDAMEKWYRNQRQIQDSHRREEKETERAKDAETQMEDVEFEHLSEDEDEGDTQALGAAKEDEATAIDEDAGVAVNEQERTDQFDEKNAEQIGEGPEDIEMRDAVDEKQPEETLAEPAEDQRKAFVGEYREPEADPDRTRDISETPSERSDAEIDSTAAQLRTTALAPASEAMSHEVGQAIWNDHVARILPHSLQLQEQLRLILHPTSTSKLRGDFRTGKRLNIKRIIPYIASNFKRDKIWLRRSVPSKREYQIVIALDDSRSMAESGAGTMALDTVAMLGRALGMLEAGEMAVVGFGKEITVPVAFGERLQGEKGGEVVRTLRFEQAGTDVKALLGKAGEMFEEGRGRKRGGGGVQTWQLMLVVGDGVFDDEEGVRRWERGLREVGVMVVFVIVDADAGKGEKEGRQSIVDLKRPRFWKDAEDRTQVEISRYIETFPFRYYLIVRDVAELPNVLASALRQWFSEVAESG